MKSNKWIWFGAGSLLLVFLALGCCFLVAKTEQDRLINRALYSQKRIIAGYVEGPMDVIMDLVIKRNKFNDWGQELERVESELIAKGYFTQREFSVPTSQFKIVWTELWKANTDDELFMFSNSPVPDQNQAERQIVLIGPAERMDEMAQRLKRIIADTGTGVERPEGNL